MDVLKFLPSLMVDQAEPFAMAGIGYTVFTETAQSPSFRRVVTVMPGERVVEFACFYLYDIQHLYDLEHLWVTIDAQDTVLNVEASFHGRYLNASRLATKTEEGKFCLYIQPGKHAFLPQAELFFLLPDPNGCCTKEAGTGGFLVMDLFKANFCSSAELDMQVEAYIRAHFAFQPTWKWKALPLETVRVMPWDELQGFIVSAIQSELLCLTR